MGLNRFVKFIATLIVLAQSSYTMGEWVNYQDEIIAYYGESVEEFRVDLGDNPTYDDLPGSFHISRKNMVTMDDRLNGRVKVFDENFTLLANISPPIDDPKSWWPESIFVGEKLLFILDKLYFVEVDGKSIKNIDYTFKIMDIVNWEGKIYLKVKESGAIKWVVYNSEGEQVSDTVEPPLEVGKVALAVLLNSTGDRVDINRVSFESGSWASVLRDEFSECKFYERDKSNNVYCVKEKTVVRFNQCGNVVSSLIIPEEEVIVDQPADLSMEPYIELVSDHYDPKIDREGNVFALKRTPDTYGLVKWTWVDSENDRNEGPDAPYDVKVSTQFTHAALQWEPSFQDPGCVSGYRILRSGSVDAGFAEVGIANAGATDFTDTTVEKDKTYFYKIAAISGIGDSEFTETLSVEIK